MFVLSGLMLLRLGRYPELPRASGSYENDHGP